MSFFPRTVQAWNALLPDIQELDSLWVFKARVSFKFNHVGPVCEVAFNLYTCLMDYGTSRPLTNLAPSKLSPHMIKDRIRPLQTRPSTEIWFRRLASFIIHANHWLKTLVPIKTYADNICFDGYWHFMMLTLSIFVKERVSRILRYVYSNVHERST